MEVLIPSHNRDFDFKSARSSPQVSAPSTPTGFGRYYVSAPTSPSHFSHFCRDFDDFIDGGGVAESRVAFEWEERPGTPKSPPAKNLIDIDGDDFAFDVSQEWETASLSAEELFDSGMIKPLKPPPRLQVPSTATVGGTSPHKKPAAISRKIHGAFSPRQKNRTGVIDPFAVAAQNATQLAPPPPPHRGRERVTRLPESSGRRAVRSLSPLRNPWEEEEKASSSSNGFYSSMSGPLKSQKKWRLKDFFLFRSASEGRAADKDPLRKYAEAFRHSSFRSTDSSGSGSGSRRKGRVSAHELHYTVNREISTDLKKKTFLPYKQGILGRLAFNPAVHALANGFGFSRK